MITKTLKNDITDYKDLVISWHDDMLKNKLNLVYLGEINQTITKSFTSLAEQSMTEDNEEKRTVRKVYHVMVECLQNIYKHSDEKNKTGPGRKSQGILMVGQDKKGYIISTGNYVSKEREKKLTTLLDGINSKSVDELNQLFKKQMRDGVLSEKGGAGLGFIDISRKTGSKLEYKFESMDEKRSFFILKTYIAK